MWQGGNTFLAFKTWCDGWLSSNPQVDATFYEVVYYSAEFYNSFGYL